MADSINKLIELFSKFPAVGPRTARRFVFYLMKQPKEKIGEISNALLELNQKIKFCQFCFNPYEADRGPTSNQLCPICADPRREKSLLCVVEKETDLISIEKTKKYNGLYFILDGALRIQELKNRVKEPGRFAEIIIATNPTPEGKATSVLVKRALKETSQSPTFKITHLAQGLPVGGELEYADEETLESALEGRK